jgi:hypothetical protein
MVTHSSAVSKLGSICYVLWGFVHLQTSYNVYKVGESLPFSMAEARVYQDAWILFFFALSAIVIALWLNWRNDRVGYWINLSLISIVDIGFIVYVLIPKLVPLWPGILGPVLWISGLVFTSIAYKGSK